MPRTHAQEHALSRQHAGRNPRPTGAPASHDVDQANRVSRGSVQRDTASGAQEAGAVEHPGAGRNEAARERETSGTDASKPSGMMDASQAGNGKPHGAEHEQHDPATESELEHPQPAHHNDSEKSRLPERDDDNRKQAPNDRPGRKSGEGETPVG